MTTDAARLGASVDRHGDPATDPFISAVDVLGLYRPDVAAMAARGTVPSISDNTHDVPDD
jgi:hypothetical protein